MPVVNVEMLKGRTIEQKRAMVEKVTTVLVETLQCKESDVTIIIRDMERYNYSRSGQLYEDL